jgi:hypothetical protein
VKDGSDLVSVLSTFAATPTTEYVACESFCPHDSTAAFDSCVKACQDAHPQAKFDVAPCQEGETMRSDGSCAKEPEPTGGFQTITPVLQYRPALDPAAQIDPLTGCPTGQVKESGKCVEPSSDEGMSTGSKVFLSAAGLGLGWLALKYLR